MSDPDDLMRRLREMKQAREQLEGSAMYKRRIDRLMTKGEHVWKFNEFDCSVHLHETPNWDELLKISKEISEEYGFEYQGPSLRRFWFTGYVRIPQRYFRQRDYRGFLSYVPVHGGITFSGEDSEGRMVYGFDTQHHNSDGWTRELAIRETNKLAIGLQVAHRFEAQYYKRSRQRSSGNKWDKRRRRKRQIASLRIMERFFQVMQQQHRIPFIINDNTGAMLNFLGGQL